MIVRNAQKRIAALAFTSPSIAGRRFRIEVRFLSCIDNVTRVIQATVQISKGPRIAWIRAKTLYEAEDTMAQVERLDAALQGSQTDTDAIARGSDLVVAANLTRFSSAMARAREAKNLANAIDDTLVDSEPLGIIVDFPKREGLSS